MERERARNVETSSHVHLDGVLQGLRLGAADAVHLVRVLPEVEGGECAHTLRAHQLIRVRAAVAHDLFGEGEGEGCERLGNQGQELGRAVGAP